MSSLDEWGLRGQMRDEWPLAAHIHAVLRAALQPLCAGPPCGVAEAFLSVSACESCRQALRAASARAAVLQCSGADTARGGADLRRWRRRRGRRPCGSPPAAPERAAVLSATSTPPGGTRWGARGVASLRGDAVFAWPSLLHRSALRKCPQGRARPSMLAAMLSAPAGVLLLDVSAEPFGWGNVLCARE